LLLSVENVDQASLFNEDDGAVVSGLNRRQLRQRRESEKDTLVN
jgi:hypothetical protein